MYRGVGFSSGGAPLHQRRRPTLVREFGILTCMSSNPLRPRLRRFRAAIACRLVCICIAATARSQTPEAPANADQQEAQTRAALFRDTTFANCGDSGAYYLGPFVADQKMGLGCSGHADGSSGHDCWFVVEVDTDPANPAPFAATPDKALEGGYQWAITVDVLKIRERYRLDGVWQPWGAFRSQRSQMIVGGLFERGGEWFAADMRQMGLQTSRLVSTPFNFMNLWQLVTHAGTAVGEAHGVLRPTRFDELLAAVTRPSCADIDSSTAPVQSVHHSLNDTYARTIEIVQENKSKGAPDALGNMFSPIRALRQLDVCYSISHAPQDPPHVYRKCEKTGEVVRVPGDLDVPPDFWVRYLERCNQTSGAGLEVKLKGLAHDDGRKRFIHCGDATTLDVVRKGLIEAGVRE